MLSSSRSANAADPILSSSADWELWFFVVKNNDVWDYINPDKTDVETPSEPTKPSVATFGETEWHYGNLSQSLPTENQHGSMQPQSTLTIQMSTDG